MFTVGWRFGLYPDLDFCFNRRRITKRFKAAGRGVEIDMLLHSATRGVRDYKEGNNKESHHTNSSDFEGKKDNLSRRCCFRYQTGECGSSSKGRYRHKCILCGSRKHRSDRCSRRSRGRKRATKRRNKSKSVRWEKRSNYSKPPYPRYRRDRARVASSASRSR